VAIIAGQSGPAAPPSKPIQTPATTAAAAPQPRAAAAPTSPGVDQATARKLVDQYCVTCHNARMKTGGLVLEQAQLDLAHFGDNGELGERIIRKLRAGQMPPTDMRRPDPETMESLIRWMENEIDV